MADADEHGDGVMGWQPRDLENAAHNAHAGEELAGVHCVEPMGESVPTEDPKVLLARGALDRMSVEVNCATEELEHPVAHLGADEDGLGGVKV